MLAWLWVMMQGQLLTLIWKMFKYSHWHSVIVRFVLSHLISLLSTLNSMIFYALPNLYVVSLSGVL